MAVVTPTLSPLPSGQQSDLQIWTYANMANGDTGLPLELGNYTDRSIQVLGTFGAGGNVRMQGTLQDPSSSPTWATLTDPQGNALDITSAKIEQVSEITRGIRPNITAGDGTTSLTVIVMVKR
jgi:hypothetical protein